MTTEEELTKKIGDLGEAIKVAKAEKKPLEEWKPILDEMLALKVRNEERKRITPKGGYLPPDALASAIVV